MDDNVEKHLKFESETIKGSQTLLRQTEARLNEELRQLQGRRRRTGGRDF